MATHCFDVLEFGADAGGISQSTVAIQSAIDRCSEVGGGTVVFPNGAYLTGTIVLKSHVTLQFEVSAVLLGSPDLNDYSRDVHYQRYFGETHMDGCLIFASDAQNIAIEGKGMIDGQGALFGRGANARPMLLRFLRCHNVRLAGVRLRNPASWTAAFILCDKIFAHSLDIVSRSNYNGDGLDFDSCRNVVVSDCMFDTSDDSICLQNSEILHTSRNITVTNCVMTSRWAAMRIGLLNSGDIEDVTVSNCVFHDIECSGFKIQSAEGGRISNMVFQNIVMRNVPRPFFITLNHFRMGVDAPPTPPETGRVSGLSFDNIRIVTDDTVKPDPASAIVILGTPGHCIDDISISNCSYLSAGGITNLVENANSLPELTGVRPEFLEASVSPAYGLYARHVRNLRVSNLTLDTIQPDCRPAVVLDDVVNDDVYPCDSDLPGVRIRNQKQHEE
ncbi:MAG: glycoside hydrolase family 28 protein [Anaerolineae bacterium]